MIKTQLNPSALPGKPYSFSAKETSSAVHTGRFTQLSVIALPGGRRTFLAKELSATVHSGEFTHLSVMALPGARRYFAPKSSQVIPVTSTATGGGGCIWSRNYTGQDYFQMALKDDEDFLQILAAITPIITRH